jgi:hypothetical protein
VRQTGRDRLVTGFNDAETVFSWCPRFVALLISGRFDESSASARSLAVVAAFIAEESATVA